MWLGEKLRWQTLVELVSDGDQRHKQSLELVNWKKYKAISCIRPTVS
jgi:hypothetical protein